MMRLTIRDANKILRNYNLGKAKSIKRLTGGYTNINYKIATFKDRFLLRICKDKSLKEIQYELKVMDELKKTKFPAAYPAQRNDKKYINRTKFGKIVLYDFIDGKDPKINEQTVKEIARAVAILNSLRNWKRLKKRNPINIQFCRSLIKKFKTSTNKYPKIFKYFKEETEFLSKPLKEELPQGLIHWDIFPDNTKFKDGKLVALLDFEEACTDNLLFDAGVAINGFCFKRNKLDKELLLIFLKEYNKIRRLSPKERKLLYYYIQWAAHSMVCWHLKYLLDKKETKKLKRVNYLIVRLNNLRKMPHSIQHPFGSV